MERYNYSNIRELIKFLELKRITLTAKGVDWKISSGCDYDGCVKVLSDKLGKCFRQMEAINEKNLNEIKFFEQSGDHNQDMDIFFIYLRSLRNDFKIGITFESGSARMTEREYSEERFNQNEDRALQMQRIGSLLWFSNQQDESIQAEIDTFAKRSHRVEMQLIAIKYQLSFNKWEFRPHADKGPRSQIVQQDLQDLLLAEKELRCSEDYFPILTSNKYGKTHTY